MGKQRFDKKSAQRFRLVPGSREFIDPDSLTDQNHEFADSEARKAEQAKYGISFDDDYNYMQHLRSSSEIARLEPLSSKNNPIFSGPSVPDVEESDTDTISDGDIDEVDLQLEVEDADMDVDNELEDDFIVQANCGVLPTLDERGVVSTSQKRDATNSKQIGNQEDSDSEDYDESDDISDDLDDMEHYFKEKFRLGNVAKGNTERDLLEERLAKVFEDYNDDDMGALDDEEIRGGSLQPGDDLFKQAEEDFERRRRVNKKPTPCAKDHVPISIMKSVQEECDDDESANDSESETEFEKIKVPVKPKLNKLYNCESILSITSSCIPSHLPRMIVEKSIRRTSTSTTTSKSQNLPEEKVETEKCDMSDESDDGSEGKGNSLFVRKRGETAEERKARKAAVKEIKKERREQKKTLKSVFRSEKSAIEREMASSNLGAVRLA